MSSQGGEGNPIPEASISQGISNANNDNGGGTLRRQAKKKKKVISETS